METLNRSSLVILVLGSTMACIVGVATWRSRQRARAAQHRCSRERCGNKSLPVAEEVSRRPGGVHIYGIPVPLYRGRAEADARAPADGHGGGVDGVMAVIDTPPPLPLPYVARDELASDPCWKDTPPRAV